MQSSTRSPSTTWIIVPEMQTRQELITRSSRSSFRQIRCKRSHFSNKAGSHRSPREPTSSLTCSRLSPNGSRGRTITRSSKRCSTTCRTSRLHNASPSNRFTRTKGLISLILVSKPDRNLKLMMRSMTYLEAVIHSNRIIKVTGVNSTSQCDSKTHSMQVIRSQRKTRSLHRSSTLDNTLACTQDISSSTRLNKETRSPTYSTQHNLMQHANSSKIHSAITWRICSAT